MNTKILAVALAALLVAAGGAAAVGSTVADDDQRDTRDADIAASYDGANVTVTVTNGGDPVPNATVEVGDEESTTDANGTVTAAVDDDGEVDVEVEAPGFEGEHEYAVVDGDLVLQEESFQYDVEEDDDEEDDDDADEDETQDGSEEADEDDEGDDDDDEKEGDDDEEDGEDDDEEDDET